MPYKLLEGVDGSERRLPEDAVDLAREEAGFGELFLQRVTWLPLDPGTRSMGGGLLMVSPGIGPDRLRNIGDIGPGRARHGQQPTIQQGRRIDDGVRMRFLSCACSVRLWSLQG